MQVADWTRIKNFGCRELAAVCESGNWQALETDLLVKTDLLRDLNGGPVRLNSAWATEGHTKGSYHYRGRALDGVLLRWYPVNRLAPGFPADWKLGLRSRGQILAPRPLAEQYMLASRIFRGGLGIYFDWRVPGLHWDIRTSTGLAPHWWRMNGTYVTIGPDNLDILCDLLADNSRFYI